MNDHDEDGVPGPTPEDGEPELGTRTNPAAGPQPPAPSLFTKGMLIDRYVALEVIGSGGVGVVLKAFDPDLERWVAIKLLHRLKRSRDAASQERFLREAQAIAKVSSPNVVAVYDVGIWNEELFIAMEYVEGDSLRVWLEAEPRGTRAILDAFARAGRGLMDAHAKAVVHRDFKPDNVLVGRDGRVRVLDFGLARLLESDASLPTDAGPDAEPSAGLTRTGAFMGTPPYMAPEQYRGEPSDARSDQFAFCVALYEALAGERPFRGDTIRDLEQRILAGTHQPLHTIADKPPAWVSALVERGLSVRPEDRFPSMAPIVEHLERQPSLGRRWITAAVAAISLLAVAGVGWTVLERDPASICKRAAEKVTAVWSGARADQLHRSFASTGRAHFDATHERVVAGLDDYSTQWSAMHADACEATHARGEQSPQLFDLRMHCLNRRLGSMRALVDQLTTTSSAGVLDKAVEAVLDLDPIEACGDVEHLTAETPLPDDPKVRAKLEELRPQIDAASALLHTGQYRQGLARAVPLVEVAKATGYAPGHAEVLYLVNRMQQDSAQFSAAERTALELAQVAAAAHDDEQIAITWMDLVYIIGSGLKDPKRAATFVPIAEAATVRAGPDDQLEAKLHNVLGSLHQGAGEQTEAAREFERAVSIWSRSGPSAQRSLSRALSNLATVLEKLSKYDEAEALHRKSLAIKEKLLGPEHPDLGPTLEGLANLAKSRGDFETSNAYQARALQIYVGIAGDENAEVARVLYSMGWNQKELGQFDDAERSFQRAIAIQEKVIGKEHPELGFAWNGLGDLYVYQRKDELARDCFLRSLALWDRIQHPDVAIPLANLGDLSNRTGRPREAMEYCGRALGIDEKALGLEHPDLAFDLTCLGEAHLGMQRSAAAIPLLERALRLRTAVEVSPVDLAATRLALAKALGASKQQRVRARQLAEQARDAFAAAGKAGDEKRELADRWLRENEGP